MGNTETEKRLEDPTQRLFSREDRQVWALENIAQSLSVIEYLLGRIWNEIEKERNIVEELETRHEHREREKAIFDILEKNGI